MMKVIIGSGSSVTIARPDRKLSQPLFLQMTSGRLPFLKMVLMELTMGQGIMNLSVTNITK
jgi:hypothetical protein